MEISTRTEIRQLKEALAEATARAHLSEARLEDSQKQTAELETKLSELIRAARAERRSLFLTLQVARRELKAQVHRLWAVW